MTPYQTLSSIRDRLASLTGVETCRIGLESNMTPADYPIIRIVPSSLQPNDEDHPDPFSPRMDLLIYYGAQNWAFEDGGIQAQYEWLMDMEAKIKACVIPGQGYYARWVDTVLDEDRLPGFKLFASRFVVWGS